MKRYLIFLLSAVPIFANAQDPNATPKFGISFSGFIKTDAFFDTRQTVNIREGHFLLYPEASKPDLNGSDINSKNQSGILSIQSRITGRITGPDIQSAKTSALIEGDFFGNENAGFSDVNGFRLRHALIRINWKSTELLVGQYWHPLFVPECFPDVVSFNTGAPFQPFSRNPQLRLTQAVGNFKFILAALEQRDFTSNGPDGSSSRYLRNGVIPDMNLHIQYSYKWNENGQIMIGIGGEYKQLVPRLFTQVDKNLKDGSDSIYNSGDDKIKSSALTVYGKITTKPVTFKAYGFFGGNMFDVVMLGGYAVSSITDSSQMKYSYTPVNNISLWTELMTNGKTQLGIFGGFTKNTGTREKNMGIYYSRGTNINSVYRISPRIVFNLEKLRISTELEYTVAQYGKADVKGIVGSGLNTVSNIRLLVAFYYFF